MKLYIPASLASLALYSTASAQVTQRVSVDSSGNAANGHSIASSMTPDGRFLAFVSFASNLVPGDTNGVGDFFVRDRQTGMTERVSIDSNGAQANGMSQGGDLSSDGRFVSFSSFATNLVPGDTNGRYDAFLRDRALGTTERLSLGPGGVQGNQSTYASEVTPDGRYVLLSTLATNLIPGGTNGHMQVLLRDRQTGSMELISVNSSGVQGTGGSNAAAISDDGRFVSFVSAAGNLVFGDSNGGLDVFLRDRVNGTTTRVSASSSGQDGGFADEVSAGMSSNGAYVVFSSGASSLVLGDTNAFIDVFIHDRLNGTTERISLAPGGGQSNGDSDAPAISADGRYVQFASAASNLIVGDTNGEWDVFIHDRLTGQTERVSVAHNGAQANGDCRGFGIAPSADGRFVQFGSDGNNLVPGDTNATGDEFVRDRFGGPAFTSLCDPGAGGVIPCACSNPPVAPGRGCDNSSSTGGAILSASGGTWLSSDSLVFTTSGERPTALSIVAQWIGANAGGVVFGMGVRCTSGTFKRLFSKNAVGGSITVPDFGAGDPTVSARSAAKGDTILAGQSRWYVVYYRDPNVLGGCPAASNFNATQTGQVSWSP